MVSLSKSVSKVLGSTGKIKLIKSVDDFVLKNVYFLYSIVVFSILNLVFLSIKGSFLTIVTFVVIGFLMSFFSKNMVVILLIANVLSSILYLGTPKLGEGFKEGARHRKKKKKTPSPTEEPDEEEPDEEEPEEEEEDTE
jgi:hypothetical protein